MSEPPRVVIDACVLAGSVRRHIITLLVSEGCFSPVVSEEILQETEGAIPKTLRNSDFTADEQVAYTREVMSLLRRFFSSSVSDVDTSELLKTSRRLPDPDDEHVLGLAITTGASMIVTDNLKDFPLKALSDFDIKPISTDQFVVLLLSRNRHAAADLIRRLQAALNWSDDDRPHICRTLRRVGLKHTAKVLSHMSGTSTD